MTRLTPDFSRPTPAPYTWQDYFLIGLWVVMLVTFVVAFFGLVLLSFPAHAHDYGGKWKDDESETAKWFRGLMQPDNPEVSCCGKADAYWADEIQVKDGKVYAIITDERDDEPLGRPHVKPGTRIEVPERKYKYDRGNPVGHTIIFLTPGLSVMCFVQGGGI